VTAATLSSALRAAEAPGPELADWLDSLPERPDRIRAWPLIGRLPPYHKRGSADWPVATLAVPFNIHDDGRPVGPVWILVFAGETPHPDCKEVSTC